jgi:hypothetical protein
LCETALSRVHHEDSSILLVMFASLLTYACNLIRKFVMNSPQNNICCFAKPIMHYNSQEGQ